MEELAWIDFDILKVKDLKENYQENIDITLEMLPENDWRSPAKTIDFFKKNFAIELKNVKINHVGQVLEELDHDSEAFDALNGYHIYLRLTYAIRNYLDNILKHEENGRIYLRQHQGEWVFPNKRPLSASPEIQGCITSSHIPRRSISYGKSQWKKQRRR